MMLVVIFWKETIKFSPTYVLFRIFVISSKNRDFNFTDTLFCVSIISMMSASSIAKIFKYNFKSIGIIYIS